MNGPFLFAWVDPTETTFDASHHRVDEEIFSFELTQNEGDFATLDLTIRNPRVGLLAPGRKVWAWFAINRSWTPETASESEPSSGVDVKPLFFGRLVGIPEDMPGEAIRLQFIARPDSFAAQQAAFAETLKVQPYWDGIWFDPNTRDDPDNVLESRSALWHTDRVTHQVTISDIITGEDGDLNITPDQAFYDSVSISHGQPAVRRVTVNADVSWTQSAAGNVFIPIPPIVSLTADGLVNDWPKKGESIGGGWSVAATSVTGPNPASRQPEEHEDETNLAPLPVYRQTVDIFTIPTSPFVKGYQGRFADWYGFQGSTAKIWFPEKTVNGNITAGFSANRQRKETLSFTLEADVQAILTEPGDEEFLEISMTSAEVVDAVDPGGLMPLRDLRSAVYFSTARGTQSVEYLLTVARAKLLARSRAVTVDFEIPFTLGVDLDLSCRKNAILEDDRLPGGIAGGKITSYTLSLDGDSGQASCSISIGCTVGKGNTVSAVDGEPDYVDDDYVEPDYQFYTGQFVMPVVGEIAYESIEGLGPNDDGVDFFRMTRNRVVKQLAINNATQSQLAAIDNSFHDVAADPPELFDRLNALKTTVTLELVPVTGGPFKTDFPLNVSPLMVPKTIDLEASS